MSHSRDNLLPDNDWPIPIKPGHITMVESEMTTIHETREVCRIYVLPERKRKTKKKKGKRK